jgi:hypothetical protein
VTELTGIAVVQSARDRGVGAAIYARVGFIPVATACIAEADSD